MQSAVASARDDTGGRENFVAFSCDRDGIFALCTACSCFAGGSRCFRFVSFFNAALPLALFTVPETCWNQLLNIQSPAWL